MSWTKADYIRNWPDGPNAYSGSGEVHAKGQLVDESAMLRAMDKYYASPMCARCGEEHCDEDAEVCWGCHERLCFHCWDRNGQCGKHPEPAA